MIYARLETPIGQLLIGASEAGAIKCLRTPTEGRYTDAKTQKPFQIPEDWREDKAGLAQALTQLREYFDGTRQEFDLDLDPDGTPFQKEVWAALQRIPYGITTSYGELAKSLGRPSASRAVGAANGKNPIAIVVPCHRVIGKDGSLTGYAGGLTVKRALLELEKVGVIS